MDLVPSRLDQKRLAGHLFDEMKRAFIEDLLF